MKTRRLAAIWMLCATAAALPAADSGGFGALLEERFRALDRDGDGKVTREEAGDAPWFKRVDRQNKGVVTIADVRALLARLDGLATLPASEAPKADAGKHTANPQLTAEASSPREGPRVLRAVDRGVGRLVPDLAFTDIEGRAGKLSDYQNAPALVIALTSTTCPLTRKYAPSLARIEREFAERGVKFLFVNPMTADAVADMREAAKENGFAGRYVHDGERKLVAGLGALTTTEVFVLDPARTLVFRGAVDDQYGFGYALEVPREEYLRGALRAVLAGKVPSVEATESPGCALEIATPVAGEAAVAKDAITYHNRISRIVQQNCLECHRSGGVGPVSLETYADVKSHAGMMRRQVSKGAMPPWFAEPGAEGEASHWRNDRSLTPADKTDLLAWLAGAKPEGSLADAPRPRVFPKGWEISKPDVVLELPRAVAVKAEGVMAYQTHVVDTRFTEDKWVVAYEVQPTAREVVHHVIVKIHPPGAKAGAERADDGASEREGFFAAYVPGNSHATFPEGFGKKIPAGARVSFQMHYTPNGKATTDRTKLGLVFAAEPPRHAIHVTGLANPRIKIPAGEPNHPETAGITLPYEVTLLSFSPHMHVRGKAARYEAVLPDGTRKKLLEVPAYDFNWQLQYKLAAPVTLPRGAKLVYTAWFDNSPGNPANPDPAKIVRWGPQTFDEMMLGYVEYYVPGQKAALARVGGDQ
ncbi:MAG: redoxin domain-containing protein [Verrucomicrobiota bacterium]